MIKLKEIISQLDVQAYNALENQLNKTKADNFLYLIKSYRNEDIKDDEIIKHLSLNSNSFYVLKSRLYDRIKSHISEHIDVSKIDLLQKLQEVHNICYTKPHEIASAFLEKLEEDLLKFDMHSELLLVYSALKKVHLHSENYFHYSQLYNKHVAFWLSLEKTEAILGNFNQILAQFTFSKSDLHLNKLLFLKKEVANHFALNPSRKIEIIKRIIDIELGIFCSAEDVKGMDVEKNLLETAQLISELPHSSTQKKWEIAIDYLLFEYYRKINPLKALPYYHKVNLQKNTLLLYSSICLTPQFFLSKIQYLADKNELDELLQDEDSGFIYDDNDTHSKVIYGLYKSMICYYSGKTKEGISILNDIINQYSFKDLFHINIEVRLTLTYFYIQLKEFDLAENLIKSIYRKIKTEDLKDYSNALDLIKFFNLEITPDSKDKNNAKKKDALTLFLARNVGKFAILDHLLFDFKNKNL